MVQSDPEVGVSEGVVGRFPSLGEGPGSETQSRR